MTVKGEPDYPVILTFTRDGERDDAPAAWCLTQGYEILSEGSSIAYSSAEASAAASTLAMGNRTRIYTNNDRLRQRLLFAGVDNVGTEQEYYLIQSGIKRFALENNMRMIARYRLEDAGKPVPVEKKKTSPTGSVKYGSKPRLTVATDASMAWQVSEIAGIAWVASDGRHAVKLANVGDGGIEVAELWAIHNIFEAMNKHQKLLIQTDSQPAIYAFENRHLILKNPAAHPSKKIEVLEAIDRCMEDRDVQLEWVKGHAGHAMNETADKLAKFSRRCFETGDESDERWLKVDTILLEGIGFDRATKSFVDFSTENQQAS